MIFVIVVVGIFVIMILSIFIAFIYFMITSESSYQENKNDFDLIDYASEKEKMLLQPIITSNDTPKIISNGDGSFHSDERIEGKSYGSLALSDEERVSMAESGWHDTGLVNGHGQPLVQNDKGEILSVCRYVGQLNRLNYICGSM